MGIIKDRVRLLRKRQTPAEKYFWEKIRKNKFGLSFRRQYPLIYYEGETRKLFIADFICKKLKIIIEIDGKIHDNQKEYDQGRTWIINQLGYKVIRFKNKHILDDFQEIEKFLSPLAGKGGSASGGDG